MRRERISRIPSPFQEQIQTHNLTPNQLADLIWNTMSDRNWLRISKPMMHAIGDRETIMLTELINLDRYYRKDGKEYTGWFWATAPVLFEHTTQLEDVQRRVLNNLVDRGLIQRKRAGVPARNYFKINYEAIPALFESNFTGTSSGETPELEIAKHRNLAPQNTGTIYKERYKEINYKESSSTKAEAADGKESSPTPSQANGKLPNLNLPQSSNGYITPSQFEDFWRAYPNHKGGRAKAKSAWERVCAKKDRPCWKALRAAISAQLRSEQWSDPQFIPHATTWLNNSRWLDDPKDLVSYKRNNSIPPRNGLCCTEEEAKAYAGKVDQVIYVDR